MIFSLSDVPPEGTLIHYGVKGMQWGVRRPHPSYSGAQQQIDRKSFGKRGTNRINRRLKRGKTHEHAVRIERRNRTVRKIALVAYGAFALHQILSIAGGNLSTHINRRTTANGARAAADVLSNSHGLPAGGMINLSFNAAKNVWE